MKKAGLGIVGCGEIAPAYIKNIKEHFSGLLEVRACADIRAEMARKRAEEFGVPKVCSVTELMADPDVEIVVNLTNPEAHHPVTMAAFNAGKHVFTEKPLGISMDEGREMVETAAAKGLMLAGAADTFLGGSLQLCRKLVDQGRIGTPLNGTAYASLSVKSGRYFRKGYGPMFDMSPYYITALLVLLGPVKSVSGMARIPFPEKVDEKGNRQKVETPTNIVGLLQFESGPVAVITAACEVSGYYPRNEVFGTDAVLTTNDANGYGGKVMLRTGSGVEDFQDPEGFNESGRALGVAEMALALREGRKPRASAEMLFHVLEITHAIHESSGVKREVDVKSSWGRPEPFEWAALKQAMGGRK